MSRMKEEAIRQQEAKDLQSPTPDDSDYEYKRKEWRPDDWEEIRYQYCKSHYGGCKRKDCEGCMIFGEEWEDGASAMLSALLKWLNEPCEEHIDFIEIGTVTHVVQHRSRKDCPSCMAELGAK